MSVDDDHSEASAVRVAPTDCGRDCDCVWPTDDRGDPLPKSAPTTRTRAVRKRLVSDTPAHYPTALAVIRQVQTLSSLYASSPWTTVSTPAISSSFVTRKPIVFWMIVPMMKASTNE